MLFTDRISEPVADDPDSLYRLIADTIPHMVWCARGDGSLDFFNRRCHDYTGLDRARLAGWGWKEVVHPEDWERCLATWTRSLQSGERYEIEYRLRRADGAYRWHHGTAVPVRDAGGGIERWFGTCTDVDEQIRSAQLLEATVRERTRALKASEERFRQLASLSADYYWETDAEDRFTEIVVGSRTPLVIPPERFIGKTRWEMPGLLPQEGWDRLRDDMVQRRPFYDFQVSAVAGDGMRRWYSISGEPVYDAEGAYLGYRGVGTHVTERVRAEQALRESEERFRSFMQYSPAIAWMKDSKRLYTYVNASYQAAYQIAEAGMLGKDDFQIAPAGLARLRRADDDEVLATRSAIQLSRTVSMPDGRERHWLIVKFPLADASGELGVAGIGVDITERMLAEAAAKRHANDVRQLLSRLVTAQELERRRVADDLHDMIGQNLSALGIELAALNAGLSRESRIAATPRVEAMSRLLGTVVDAIRGVMTELRPVALEEFGLAAALRWQAAEFTRRTGINAAVEAAAGLSRLAPSLELVLFRIVQEALTNIAKHSGARNASVLLSQDAGMVRLVVADDGRGFADPLGARSAGRGGWGLPAMRERAEAHGGELRVELPGQGAKIIAEIPFHNDDTD